jgi:hypothetical protein
LAFAPSFSGKARSSQATYLKKIRMEDLAFPAYSVVVVVV